jgi:hypothetical protein
LAGRLSRNAKPSGDGQQPVPSIIAQWRREKPNFDTGPMALFGALARAFLLTSPVIEKFMSEYGVARGMFDVLAALRRAGKPYCLPPSTLTKWLMLSGAGMTNRLDRLEAMDPDCSPAGSKRPTEHAHPVDAERSAARRNAHSAAGEP